MLDQKLSETNVYLVPNEAALNLVEAFKFNLNPWFCLTKIQISFSVLCRRIGVRGGHKNANWFVF